MLLSLLSSSLVNVTVAKNNNKRVLGAEPDSTFREIQRRSHDQEDSPSRPPLHGRPGENVILGHRYGTRSEHYFYTSSTNTAPADLRVTRRVRNRWTWSYCRELALRIEIWPPPAASGPTTFPSDFTLKTQLSTTAPVVARTHMVR